MNGAEVMDVARDALLATLLACGPIMAVGLAVGLAIALLQALTQVQEMTLVFVPKILAIFGSLFLFMPLISSAMSTLATDIFSRIAAM